ncbi:MAG: 50S ribosomal protein L20, partial [Gammaproteobacteria bacterium]|nr:50S ribosomal protein L20 [Gammaproteobacteria bacterium]
MARIKRAVHARKKKNAYFKAAKGYRGGRGRLWR